MMKSTIKTTATRTRTARGHLLNLALLSGIALGLSSGVQADTEWEWDPVQGYHEEEWYDPSDWFNDDNQIDYEPDIATTGYTYYTPYYYWDPVVMAWRISEAEEQNQQAKRNQRSQQNRADERDRQSRQQASGSDRRSVTFQGTINGFREVDLRSGQGQDERHSFVRVRLNDGQNRVVSLGSDVDVSDLDLERDQRIRVSGHTAKIDGRQVLIANRIETGGETFAIKKKNQPAGADAKPVKIKGTLADYQRASLDGVSDESLVVRLEMENGKSCVVDLGQGTTLDDLNLEEGDRIMLEGKRKKIDGKSLIVAHKIRVEGDRTRLRDTGARADQESTTYQTSTGGSDRMSDDDYRSAADDAN